MADLNRQTNRNWEETYNLSPGSSTVISLKTAGKYIDGNINLTINVEGGDGVTRSELLDLIYPVGSIYMSTADVSPDTFLGGTWERYAKGQTVVGVDEDDADFAEVNNTGGEKEVTLTADQSGVQSHGHGFTQPTVNGGSCTIANTGGTHTHNIYRKAVAASGSATKVPSTASGNSSDSGLVPNGGAHGHTVPAHTHSVSGGAVTNHSGTGAKEAHSNLQPYITCYMWKRTA